MRFVRRNFKWSTLVQNAAPRRARHAIRNGGMEFGKLGLKLFIDQQKRLQGTANIAIAPCDDFVDGGLMESGSH
jgi:hypothetical protein